MTTQDIIYNAISYLILSGFSGSAYYNEKYKTGDAITTWDLVKIILNSIGWPWYVSVRVKNSQFWDRIWWVK